MNFPAIMSIGMVAPETTCLRRLELRVLPSVRIKVPPIARNLMDRPETISHEYLLLQQELHQNPNYGVASFGHAPFVKDILQKTGARSLSDYGAGKQNLKRALHDLGLKDFIYFPYDPAFPEYGKPEPADLVCCIDVLEHIEPAFVEAVLRDLALITRNLGFFSVATGPAEKVLRDGRNAHLIQKKSSWWLPKFCEHFDILQLGTDQHGFWVVTEPRRVQ